MDPLSQFDAIVPTFQKVAAGTAREQLDQSTPCEGWRVRDLFGHLLIATTFAGLVRGDASPPEVEPVGDDAVVATATSAIADLDAAFRTPGAMERTIATPFGEMPGETFARLLAFDLLMHTWDLATATGQDLEVDDAVVTEVDGFARAAVTPEMRGPGTFGPEQQAPEGASRLEQLVAFSGRSC